jgi:hypothetical protein
MAKHRKPADHHVNPLLGGAVLATGMLMAAPAAMALADTPGVHGRPDTPFNQPVVNAIQNVGDKVFDNPDIKIPTLRASGPVTLNDTGAGQTYHALFGNSTDTLQTDDAGAKVDPSQGLTVGVVNSFATPYKITCNIAVQTRCGTVVRWNQL